MFRFRRSRRRWLIAALAAFSALMVLAAGAYAAPNGARVSFNSSIRPLLADHCVACHGGVKQAGGLSFVYAENVFAGGDSGQPAVVPGDVDASYLIDRVTDTDPDSRMPPGEHGPALTPDQIETIKDWIRSGAEWETSWGFMLPTESPPPDVQDRSWCRQPLDVFVMAKLEDAKLSPSAPAKRHEWLRRVTFDLIGLPPSSEEIEEFAADDRPDAHERVVDRLLASPHFGERWASMWLDLARYADTTGFEHDPNRDIWPYRDWVIRAFNADMPYDEFTIKQLAGDLLPSATLDDRLATAFHRNTQTNSEGGTDDEEYRIAAVIDRVNTTWTVWQATTFGCTQCHAHPYDPFRHDEYYKFLALFDDTRDSDVEEDYPKLRVPVRRADYQLANELQSSRAKLLQQLHAPARRLVERSRFHSLPIDSVVSTGSARLSIQFGEQDGRQFTDVIAEGTITTGSKFTLEAPIPSSLESLTALRIDALLRDPDAARRIPELGFVLSQLVVEVLPADGGEPLPLKFQQVFSDEADPIFDPNDSLNENSSGWACYARQWRNHYAVFVLEAATAVPSGSRIRLHVKQDRASIADAALVIGRGRFSATDDESWQTLIKHDNFTAAQKRLAKVKRQIRAIDGLDVPVMSELDADKGRTTYEFVRGLWLDKGAEVKPDTPQSLSSLPEKALHDRLTMARWLVSGANPLTARVIVNRVWEQLFGTGLVETVEDFGTSGTLPSHPELLDLLALRFQGQHDWSLKRLLREIVLSSTYRQSAAASSAATAADPQNRLLSHGPRQRLTAEMIRDQALILSGRFSSKMYGPPVMPPQPEGIWRSVYNNRQWEAAQDENRYRRALYTFWKRTSAYPSMMTFDAPSREACTARRIATNTPLQALVTLNDEAYVELAAAFAKRMAEEGGTSPMEQIAWGYFVATGHPASDATVGDLVKLHATALTEFNHDAKAGEQVAESPELAALSIVAGVILNLDEVLTR